MSELIRWCNANQGFLSGCLTLVYVVATIGLVRLSQRQLKQAVELERSRIRPFVIFDMFFERFSLYAKIANIGETVAVDVKIEISPKLEFVYGGAGEFPGGGQSKPIPFVERGVRMLAPGREIKALVGFSRNVHQAYPGMEFEGCLSYRTREGEEYKDPFIVDLAAIEALAYRGTKDIEDVAKQLEEIARTLSHLATGFSKPLVRTITEKEHTEKEEAVLGQLINPSPSTSEPPNPNRSA